jgi:flagellar biosynthesis protein FlhF
VNDQPEKRPQSKPFVAAAYLATEPPPRPRNEDVAVLRGEVKTELRALRNALAAATATSDVAAQIEDLRELLEAIVARRRGNGRTNVFTNALARAGIEGDALRKITMTLGKTKKDSPEASTAFRNALAASFRVTDGPLMKSGRAIIGLVGPSGVGKTTTSAKLAANALQMGLTVQLVACDTFRVGATFQLQRYADLMGAEFATASSGDDLDRVVMNTKADIVIVDTSGNPTESNGIARWLRTKEIAGRRRNVLLCVPAALRAADAQRLATVFGNAQPTEICITKIDETNAPGGIVHAARALRLPISMVCNGPRVPEDITQATTDGLVDALIRAAGETTKRRAA